MKPRFGITTFVQIVLSLVVLVLVGKLVDPNSGKDDKKGGHSDEPTADATKPAPASAPKLQPVKDGKPQVAQPLSPDAVKPVSPDAIKPLEPSAVQKQKMDAQREKMIAEAKKHGGTRTGKPGVAPAPDGMDPALWQDRDMGQAAPKAEVKKQ